MAHLHHLCKLCSNPAEARLTAYHDESDLTIHTATEHGAGTIRADVLFNFQQRSLPERGSGGRGPRGRGGHNDRHEEDEENVRPATPPRQDFRMETAQFPTLGWSRAV